MEKMVFSADALEGKVALITGASRGIGAAILESFVRCGATVIGTATSEEGAAKITARIAELDGKGRGAMLNVCDAAAGDALIADIVKTEGRIDILVNNAGITRDTLVMRMKDEQWDDVLDTDLSAAFRLARACVRPMMRARSGRIISMASVVGAMGNAGQVNYAAAKAGLMGMTKALAREIGSRGITVNCVAPGFIDTDMTRVLSDEQKEALLKGIPLARLGQTEDIANACLFLASDAGAYVTGTTLHVNGGMFMG
ncbi:3-oxoacyl-ACP reductase FabG [Sutterella massiliensis]|uniref:3-oxoacyl-[acyl-carrier-protein] reductase n=1 Tax=Sutterella massiliensis TaxID=1816689 RepID=A0ABS2DQ43_9BURK|nr:3-oxoacyl-ACP reductase FabG [Sutterella massiliensis]MBM6703440.1 3-oxoacyl-ACP reductase FabG [Sutterella massiliensis]